MVLVCGHLEVEDTSMAVQAEKKPDYGPVHNRAVKEIARLEATINRLSKKEYFSSQEMIDANNRIIFIQDRLNIIKELKNELKQKYNLLRTLTIDSNALYDKYGKMQYLDNIYRAFNTTLDGIKHEIMLLEAQLERYLPVEQLHYVEVIVH